MENAIPRAGAARDPGRSVPGPVLLCVLLCLATGASAKTPVLESAWRPQGDAGASAVAAPATALERGKISVAASNDDRLLYLTLTSRDREVVHSMLVNGLTLWIDPEGGRKKTLGIHYPIGGDMGGPGEPPGGPPRRGTRDEGTGGNRERPPESFIPPAQIIELLGPNGGESRRVLAGDISGLDVRFLDDEGTLTYQLTIPLAAASEKAIGVGAGVGETIGVGWVTGRPSSAGFRPDDRGPGSDMGGPGGDMGGPGGGMGGPGGGMGGPGGGMGGPGASGSGGAGRRAPASLNVWVRVHLGVSGAQAAEAPAGR